MYVDAQVMYMDAQVMYVDAQVVYMDAQVVYMDAHVMYMDAQVVYMDAHVRCIVILDGEIPVLNTVHTVSNRLNMGWLRLVGSLKL